MLEKLIINKTHAYKVWMVEKGKDKQSKELKVSPPVKSPGSDNQQSLSPPALTGV